MHTFQETDFLFKVHPPCSSFFKPLDWDVTDLTPNVVPTTHLKYSKLRNHITNQNRWYSVQEGDLLVWRVTTETKSSVYLSIQSKYVFNIVSREPTADDHISYNQNQRSTARIPYNNILVHYTHHSLRKRYYHFVLDNTVLVDSTRLERSTDSRKIHFHRIPRNTPTHKLKTDHRFLYTSHPSSST